MHHASLSTPNIAIFPFKIAKLTLACETGTVLRTQWKWKWLNCERYEQSSFLWSVAQKYWETASCKGELAIQRSVLALFRTSDFLSSTSKNFLRVFGRIFT